MLKSLLVTALALALFSQGIVHAEKPEQSEMAPALTPHAALSMPTSSQNAELAPLAARELQPMPYQAPSPMSHHISMKALLITVAVAVGALFVLSKAIPST